MIHNYLFTLFIVVLLSEDFILEKDKILSILHLGCICSVGNIHVYIFLTL